MRQLLPTPDDVDPVTAYLAADRPRPDRRPWVTVGMITCLDGATAVDGRSGGLGGDADKAVFRAVRGIADVILVAAGTVRAEGYKPVQLSDAVRAARVEAGRSPEPPRLAIVTGSLDLDLDGPLFADDSTPPLVFTTTDADPERVEAVEAVTEVRRFGTDRVDLAAALGSLGDDGVGVVVCEGGPTLNAALAESGLVDELCLSISPVLAGGDSTRIVSGAEPLDIGLEIVSLLVEDGLLFGRWSRVSRPAAAGAG